MRLLIFTYAPAGLGHLRVTDALAHSRPENTRYILLGSYDRFMTWIHRLTSINPLAKAIFLMFQSGIAEDVFTKIYRWMLVKTSRGVYEQLLDIIHHTEGVSEVLIVATHFGMAHQIGAVKSRIEKDTGLKVRLIVQVTDDTSQHIWCVRGADLTMVPSEQTKLSFEEYAKQQKITFTGEVCPYPVSPVMSEPIPVNLGKRSDAFDGKTETIKIAVPISGAAVGLPFLISLINSLVEMSGRFEFWVLAKRTTYTEMYLRILSSIPRVHIISGRNDNEMISLYEMLYQDNLINIEITKPSEQAFKALLHPKMIGGSILLFTSPVGRQEFDNIDFLIRHGLVPKTGSDNESVLEDIPQYPRGIRLSKNPQIAAKFMLWGVDSGLFSKMVSEKYEYIDKNSDEVSSYGAKTFWEKVEKHFG